MLETSTLTQEQARRRADWSWLIKILYRPRKTLAAVLQSERAVWLPALLALSLAAVLLVVSNGIIRQKIGLGNPAQLPEYFEYYSPEQQQQFMQALDATSGAAFVFVLPAMASLVKVWLGWLIVGSLVYLSLTAVGSGIKSRTALNVVAWASIPLALRDLVRAIAVLASSQLIQAPGLSGFTSAAPGNSGLFINALLTLIDAYWIWQVVLINLGAASAGKATVKKTVAAVTFTMLIILLLQAGIGFGMLLLGSKVSAFQVFL